MKGLLVCFEGLDNSGKTTQVTRLAEILSLDEINTKVFSFPNKETRTWSLIDSYNLEFFDLHPKAAHLLYSANRWEIQTTIRRYLDQGYVCLVDRYFYSGIAYSCGYHHVDLEWALNSDAGMILPDVVFYFETSEQERVSRYGNEGRLSRYDNTTVQRDVERIYRRLIKPSWILVNGNDPVESISTFLLDTLKPKVLSL